MSEGMQRRVLGDPEIITESGNGIQHKVRFELGENKGVSIVVAVETEDSPARGLTGKTLGYVITNKLYLETVQDPDDPAAVQAAIAKVREHIANRT